MKKHLLIVLFALSVLCVGAFAVNAKTPHLSTNAAKSSKTSASETQIKLAKIRSITKRNKITPMSCLELLEQVEDQWNWAQFVCWSGWGSCQGAIDETLRLGNVWGSAGCNNNPGYVIAKNSNKGNWLIREVAKIG